MIVDDHPVVREGLRQLLELDEGIRVIAEAKNGLECLRLLEKCYPDIILMDVRMPGISGIETTALVSRQYPRMKTIMLTIYEDSQSVAEAVRAGAKGYILKKVEKDELIKIVRHVMEDGAFLDPFVTESFFNQISGVEKVAEIGGGVSLTRRELEVLYRLALGQKDRDIGRSLCISEHTVHSHIKKLYRKLGVSSRSQAVAKAIRAKIISNLG